MLSLIEHENSFITSGPDEAITSHLKVATPKFRIGHFQIL